MKILLAAIFSLVTIVSTGQQRVTPEILEGEWKVISYQTDATFNNPIWKEEVFKSKERFVLSFSADGSVELKNTAIESGFGTWELDDVNLVIEYDNAVSHQQWQGVIAMWQDVLTYEVRHDDYKEQFTLQRP